MPIYAPRIVIEVVDVITGMALLSALKSGWRSLAFVVLVCMASPDAPVAPFEARIGRGLESFPLLTGISSPAAHQMVRWHALRHRALEALDVVEHIAPRLILRPIAAPVSALSFGKSEESYPCLFLATVSDRTHPANEMVIGNLIQRQDRMFAMGRLLSAKRGHRRYMHVMTGAKAILRELVQAV